MIVLFVAQVLGFAMVAAGGTAVVLTRDPRRQAIVLSVYGLILTIFFLLLQAPDVALSELTVGSAALPLMLLVALAKAERFQK
jgi:energy-converting hydrogenase B subunit D